MHTMTDCNPNLDSYREHYPDEFIDWLKEKKPCIEDRVIPIAFAGWCAAIETLQNYIRSLSNEY